MKITVKNFALAAGVCGFLFWTNIAAQTTLVKPSVKRNSPLSPNPKRKAETAPNKAEEKNVKIQNAELTVKNEGETENSQTAPTGDAENQTDDSETRTAANKTLEIAKRSAGALGATKKPTEIYKVGIGDVLDIRILNSPSAGKSTLFTVLESGQIDYPLAGEEPIQVSGFTTEEIEELLKEKVKLYENPEITVTVRDYASHTVSILGLVERPGTKALRREAIPLYVILAEAIPHSAANQVTILRGADKQTINVALEDNETLIYPNDVIRVIAGNEKALKSQQRFYYIGGQINSGGQKDYHDGLTLTQAILASGGLKKNSARKIVIRRRDEEGKLAPTEYDLKLIKDGKIADPVLQAGDTVEVGN